MAAALRFLGCKIQLISKSDIRYEGTLYTIDTEQSSVALANVRSFGTEGRRPQNPVPPANEIYDYIIFRVSDIQDLSVCEVPPPSQHGFPHPMMNYQYQPSGPYGYQAYPNQYPYYPVGRGGGYQQQGQQIHHPMGSAQPSPSQFQGPSQVQAQSPSPSPQPQSAPIQQASYAGVASHLASVSANQSPSLPQQGHQQPQVRPNQSKSSSAGGSSQENINEKAPVISKQEKAEVPVQEKAVPEKEKSPIPVVELPKSSEPVSRPAEPAQKDARKENEKVKQSESVVASSSAANPSPSVPSPSPSAAVKKVDETEKGGRPKEGSQGQRNPNQNNNRNRNRGRKAGPNSSAAPSASSQAPVPAPASTPVSTPVSAPTPSPVSTPSSSVPAYASPLPSSSTPSSGAAYSSVAASATPSYSAAASSSKRPNGDLQPFDFEKSNSRFDKDKARDEVVIDDNGKSAAQVSVAYKKENFFDTLSCETLEKQSEPEGAPFSYDEQRKRDFETFGASSVNEQHRNARGRGGPRHYTHGHPSASSHSHPQHYGSYRGGSYRGYRGGGQNRRPPQSQRPSTQQQAPKA